MSEGSLTLLSMAFLMALISFASISGSWEVYGLVFASGAVLLIGFMLIVAVARSYGGGGNG